MTTKRLPKVSTGKTPPPMDPKTSAEDAPKLSGANAGHNVNDTTLIVQAALKSVLKLEASKAEINAAIREAKAPVKGAGIKIADFNMALRLHKLEEEDRNASLDNMMVLFEAMGIGHQLELFSPPQGTA